MGYTVNELSNLLGFSFAGNPDLELTHACGLSNLTPGGVAFISDPDGLASVPLPDGVATKKAENADLNIDPSQIALVVADGTDLPGYTLIFADDPLVLHVEISKLLHPLFAVETGVHPTAVIDPDAQLADGVSIGPCAVIYGNVSIGKNTQIHAGTIILPDVTIGEDCLIYPNTVIREKCIIGSRVVIHPNVVIGSDGHGYFQREGLNYKIPQIGKVIIEDDVEIGACSTVNRGRLEDTVIGKGSKLDDQVLIAHNVEIGEQALISGQSAIGGSTKTGHHMILAGQTGIKDNVKIGDNVVLAARGAIMDDVKDGSVLGGSPARTLDKWKSSLVYINGLENLYKKVQDLKEEIKKLQG